MNVPEAVGAGDAIFGIIGRSDIICWIGGHVSGSIVTVAGEPIVDEGWGIQQFCAALSDRFAGEIAPCIIAAAVTPVFRLAIRGACSTILIPAFWARGDAVQQIIIEALIARTVLDSRKCSRGCRCRSRLAPMWKS